MTQLIDAPIQSIATTLPQALRLLAIVATIAEGKRQTRDYSELFQVTVADTLADGLAHARSWVPDVITLDTEAYYDGRVGEALATLRADLRLCHTAFCFISDDSRVPTKIDAFQQGADHYIVRNLDPRRQLAGIHRAMLLARLPDHSSFRRDAPHA